MSTASVLQLRRSATPQREIAAWYLPGGEPQGWLAEMSQWDVPLEKVRCYVVPRSAGDKQASGVLAVLPAGTGHLPQARGLACGLLNGNLFLPIDAGIFPPVTSAEVAALCRAAVAFFHPGIGFIEFAPDEARAVWDLLAPAELAANDWNGARAGAALDSRLTAVILPVLPKMEDLFGEVRDEIGHEPMKGLPPREGEPSAGTGARMSRALRKFGATLVQRLFSHMPSKGPRRTWINDVLDWASAKLGAVSQELEELRNQELLRLMELLQKDPDRGLRHALPLGGAPPRGIAPPGAHLGTRPVDFNLRHLGGGRPNDPWNVPWQMRQKLIARYRELALHEKELGRFKRAAYIYAELLGDLNSAAAVLKEGRFFADAAVLYRDHLRQMMAAAECFMEAALFSEAILIYAKEGKWEELGALHRRLGDEDKAVAVYRLAVERKISTGDFIGAAQLLEVHLKHPEEALALLRNGWRVEPQAAACLAAEFALLGRLGTHVAAMERLATLRAEKTAPAKIVMLGEILAGLHTNYPDTAVRQAASDLARVKISDRLVRSETVMEIRAATRVLSRLAPEDRLLARDTSRFVALRSEQLSARLPPALPRPRKTGSGRIEVPKLVNSLQLPSGLRWMAVRRLGQIFIAAARKGSANLLLRGKWSGRFQATEMPDLCDEQRPVSILGADESLNQPEVILVLPVHNARFTDVPVTDWFDESVRVGSPSWVLESVLAMSVSGSQWWSLWANQSEIILDQRAEDGRLMGNFDASSILEDVPAPATFSLLALGTHVWVACGPNLALLKGGRIVKRWRLESPILGFEATAPFLTPGIVARCEQGAAVFWHEALSERVEMIAHQIHRPRAVFLRNGVLVLLGKNTTHEGPASEGLVLDIDRRCIHGEATFFSPGESPIALIGTDRPDEFAIFDGTNSARIMRVPVKP